MLADRLVGQSFCHLLLLLLVLTPSLLVVYNLLLALEIRFQTRLRQSYSVLVLRLERQTLPQVC
jgi:hypothetical protein